MSNLCRLNNDTICLGCYVTVGSGKTHGFIEMGVSLRKNPCWLLPFCQRKQRLPHKSSVQLSEIIGVFHFVLTNLTTSRVDFWLELGMCSLGCLRNISANPSNALLQGFKTHQSKVLMIPCHHIALWVTLLTGLYRHCLTSPHSVPWRNQGLTYFAPEQTEVQKGYGHISP